jgi:Inositol polyphosphate kinase
VLRAHEDGVTGYQLQVAGHGGDATKKNTPGSAILKWKHFTLKPLQTKSRGVREVDFYESLSSAHHEDAEVKIDREVLAYLKGLTPSYHGVVQVMIDTVEQTFDYIVLQDITHGYSPACVMDVKIGRKMYEESAPEVMRYS